MKYRSIPFQEYQARATKILEDCGVGEKDHLPIDPERIIRKLGMQPIPMKDLKVNFGVKGFVAKYRSALQIYVDEYHYLYEPESSLFTLAEELGHTVLHLIDFEKINSIKDWIAVVAQNARYHKYVEQQARCFASHLLLPEFLFDRYVQKWMRENVRDVKRWNHFSYESLAQNVGFLMADELGVSEWIIGFSLMRWPDHLIEKIVQMHPDLLGRKMTGE